MSEFLEPSFEFLIGTLRLQAEAHMGLLRIDPNQPPQANLPMARHMIDLIAMLQAKTKGNLSLEESRLVENSLTELRFRYVQAVESTAKAGAEAGTEAAADADSKP
jgi:hypothetical protein